MQNCKLVYDLSMYEWSSLKLCVLVRCCKLVNKGRQTPIGIVRCKTFDAYCSSGSCYAQEYQDADFIVLARQVVCRLPVGSFLVTRCEFVYDKLVLITARPI